jgi:hypothetical protein
MHRDVDTFRLGPEFRVAAALTQGASRSRLRGKAFERPFHGVRQEPLTTAERSVRAQLDPWTREREDVLRRARAYRCIMPGDAFFTGPTAAALLDLPLPPGMSDRLWVGVPHPRTAPERPGIRGVQILPRMVRVIEHGGLRVADPASTWASLGGVLGAYDLTAVADRILRRPRHPGRPGRGASLATRDDLADALAAGRRRGADALWYALASARDGVSSRPETWVRLELVDAGLPEPELDVDVYRSDGAFLGCSEVVYRRERVAVEYEGLGHLTPEQLRRDAEKYTDYQAAGWGIVRLTHHHVFGERIAARRVFEALHSRRT